MKVKVNIYLKSGRAVTLLDNCFDGETVGDVVDKFASEEFNEDGSISQFKKEDNTGVVIPYKNVDYIEVVEDV